MGRVRVIVARQGKVVRSGVACILSVSENLDIIGDEGAGLLDEAVRVQPDMVVYQLFSEDEDYSKIISKLKEMCSWVKLVIFSPCQLNRNDLRYIFSICNGYIQGPILSGFFLQALELACYTGRFLFLGLAEDIKIEEKKEVRHVLVNSIDIIQ
ncbi:MAG: hypothetical protein FH756_07285 [Firmicutes bacterium]|nr:hypothetical protein [Bacillota bacterium]